jgi:hypothetical protein
MHNDSHIYIKKKKKKKSNSYRMKWKRCVKMSFYFNKGESSINRTNRIYVCIIKKTGVSNICKLFMIYIWNTCRYRFDFNYQLLKCRLNITHINIIHFMINFIINFVLGQISFWTQDFTYFTINSIWWEKLTIVNFKGYFRKL